MRSTSVPVQHRPARRGRPARPWRRPLAAGAAAAAAVCLTAAAPAAAAGPAGPCADWTTTVVAGGLGNLENLHPDGAGGLYLSVNDQGAVRRLAADGTVSTVATGVDGASGLRLVGDDLYVLSGNTPLAILLAPATGALHRIDTRTGRRTVVAGGLRAPNGLVTLPDGTMLASRLNPLGLLPTGITRIDPRSGAVQRNWSPVATGNGMVVAPDGRSVYVNQSLTGEVLRVPLDAPNRPVTVARIPGLLPAPDDLDITRDGVLYLATHSEGAVHRVDPRSGDRCTVATGLTQPTAVKVDPAGTALFVTSFDGTVKKLTPPAGARP